ncbi:unnamed protein product [Allacma fusca]|uniref:F-box domain-containing protein n=1 Tax=Allacma fusca TaxID=39272 RepID=A0A8J2KFY5_9HEXA|nr:unnamed protein product [Allacma fusca]
MSGMFSVCSEDIIVAANTDFVSVLDAEKDFVQFFPPELCNKLFSYVSDKDIFACSQCSIEWRHVINNNSQWKRRCILKGWYKLGKENDRFKWTKTKSHVGDEEYQFRRTPLFSLPPVASLRVTELCDWAKYYRQCAYLENNWKLGRYALHKLTIPEDVVPTIYNACDCNGKIFAAGTTMGYILIWCVDGRPHFVKSILASGRRIEVEQLHMNNKCMVVLCQSGVMQCYNISNEVMYGHHPYEITYQLRIGGRFINENTYAFHVDLLTPEQIEDVHRVSRSNRSDEATLFSVGSLPVPFTSSICGMGSSSSNSLSLRILRFAIKLNL